MKRKLGDTGLAVEPVGLGGMPLSIQGRPDERTALAVIDAFLAAGGDHIDTAISYCLDDHDFGHNERLIAKALRNHPGSNVVVATKGGLTLAAALLRAKRRRARRTDRALLPTHRRSGRAARRFARRARTAARRR
jgi:aryl-alcohol dehydrogenase-like predicted oxidoreductase